jgi:hypothetical protein
MTAATLSVLLLLVAGVYTVTAQGRGGAPGALRPQVVDVGVILDRKTWVGNISWTCIELAMEDFYASPRHAGYSTRLKLHLRDTGLDAVSAAAAGIYAYYFILFVNFRFHCLKAKSLHVKVN